MKEKKGITLDKAVVSAVEGKLGILHKDMEFSTKVNALLIEFAKMQETTLYTELMGIFTQDELLLLCEIKDEIEASAPSFIDKGNILNSVFSLCFYPNYDNPLRDKVDKDGFIKKLKKLTEFQIVTLFGGMFRAVNNGTEKEFARYLQGGEKIDN